MERWRLFSPNDCTIAGFHLSHYWTNKKNHYPAHPERRWNPKEDGALEKLIRSNYAIHQKISQMYNKSQVMVCFAVCVAAGCMIRDEYSIFVQCFILTRPNENADKPPEMVVVKMGSMGFWNMNSFSKCNGYNLKAIQTWELIVDPNEGKRLGGSA